MVRIRTGILATAVLCFLGTTGAQPAVADDAQEARQLVEKAHLGGLHR